MNKLEKLKEKFDKLQCFYGNPQLNLEDVKAVI